jgi:small subunit ribosomal protein S16
LRLRRIGKKKMPAYHIVAADSRAARTGKFLEIVGRYEPMESPALISTKEERLFYWLKHGALPTDTVRSILRKDGSWIKWSLKKKGTDEAGIAREMEKWQMLQDGKRQREQERKARRSSLKKQAKKAGTAEPAQQEAAAPAEPAGSAAG